MQLVLADYIKHNPAMSAVMEKAADLITWFNNHSFALHLFYAEQRTCPEVMSINRLIRISKPMKSVVLKRKSEIRDSAGKTQKEKAKADEILHIVEDAGFWTQIERCVTC